MSVRYEWMRARTASTEVVTAGCELGTEVVDAPLALLVACDEVTVIEGSGEELQELLNRALDQVRAATGDPLMSATPATPSDTPSAFTYDRWRHGGWYVLEVRYPNGAIGCVSRNYPDRKWRIVCDRRPGDITYRSRDAAARAEYQLARAQHADTSTANSPAPVDNSSQ